MTMRHVTDFDSQSQQKRAELERKNEHPDPIWAVLIDEQYLTNHMYTSEEIRR